MLAQSTPPSLFRDLNLALINLQGRQSLWQCVRKPSLWQLLMQSMELNTVRCQQSVYRQAIAAAVAAATAGTV